MKKIPLLSLVSVIFVSSTAPALAQPRVSEFTLNQLTGGGCGMTLWKPNRANKNLYVFWNGIEPNSMEMKINGKMTKFRRIKASGQDFYNQKTSQTFRSKDGKIMVDVNVKLGAPGEIESVAIKEGTIRVRRGGQEVKIPVVGDAGC